jgi:hypothetical protein
MERKQKLIASLRLAIDALKNNTIHYDWVEQSSCNAGVVSQAVLGESIEGIDERRQSLFKTLKSINKERVIAKKPEISLTWQNAIQYGCPITGKNMPQIIVDLEEAGLSKNDIVHLEFMSNPAILAASDIEKVAVRQKVQVSTNEKTVQVPSPGFFNWLLGKKETKTISEPVYEEKIVRYEYTKDYYTKKENLIKYLSAWLRILTQDLSFETDSQKLNAELLIAVSEENYERAAEIRNRLAVLI